MTTMLTSVEGTVAWLAEVGGSREDYIPLEHCSSPNSYSC